MNKIFLPLFCIMLLFNGCAWLNPKQDVPAETTQYVQMAKVIDKDRLAKGGKLLLVAFRPGPEVVANDEFDKTAFMVIKGVADELAGANVPFELLDAARADEAELILDGWIKSTGKTSLMRKIMFRRDKVELVIEAKIVDRENGRNILVFTNTREAENKNETPKQLGLIMGYDLGQFIINELKR